MQANLETPTQLLFEELAINLNEVPFEQLVHYTAVEYFLTIEDEPPSDATNLEKVNRYLESFEHLCNAKDWQRASEIIFSDIGQLEELQYQLIIWNYHEKLIGIYQKLLNRLDDELNIFLINNLANIYNETRSDTEAEILYLQLLKQSQKNQDILTEAVTAENLGCLYLNQGKYAEALNCFELALNNAREIQDLDLQSHILGNTADYYGLVGEYSLAIDCYHQALEMSLEIAADIIFIANCFINLGNTYISVKDYTKAIEYLDKGLSVANEIEDNLCQVHAYTSLGNVYHEQENYDKAIDYYHQSLDLLKDFPDLDIKSSALCDLGTSLFENGQDVEAILSFQQSLEIALKINEPRTAAIAYYNLAKIAESSNEDKIAFEYCSQALTLATELGIPLAKECQELKDRLLNEAA